MKYLVCPVDIQDISLQLFVGRINCILDFQAYFPQNFKSHNHSIKIDRYIHRSRYIHINLVHTDIMNS